MIIAVTLVILGVAGTGTGLWYYTRTQTVWVDSPPYERSAATPAKNLVVVYSRTGNTLYVAKEAARFFDADLLQIRAPAYARTLDGQLLASRHADEHVTTTPIRHVPVDLSRYDLIVLCAPTWWFRPAPPIWSFVENHDFTGKPVLLLMTGNSRREEEHTARFRALVKKKGGRVLDDLFLRRGRITWQKTPAEVNDELRRALEERQRAGLWPDPRGRRPAAAAP